MKVQKIKMDTSLRTPYNTLYTLYSLLEPSISDHAHQRRSSVITGYAYHQHGCAILQTIAGTDLMKKTVSRHIVLILCVNKAL